MNLLRMNVLLIVSMVGLQKVNQHALYHLQSDQKSGLFFLYTLMTASSIGRSLEGHTIQSCSSISSIKEKVIPHTTPHPGSRSVLIMDNAKIHHHPVCLHDSCCLLCFIGRSNSVFKVWS